MGDTRKSRPDDSGDDSHGRSVISAMVPAIVVVRWMGFVALMVVTLFWFTFANCVFWATVAANSHTKDPPQVFQWAKGRECTGRVWRSYLRLD